MTYPYWALMNTVVCGAIMVICICRLGKSHVGVFKMVRLKYTLLLTGACAYGTQTFLFNTWPTPAGMFFAITVLGGLFSSANRWRHAPPEEVTTQPAELT